MLFKFKINQPYALNWWTDWWTRNWWTRGFLELNYKNISNLLFNCLESEEVLSGELIGKREVSIGGVIGGVIDGFDKVHRCVGYNG